MNTRTRSRGDVRAYCDGKEMFASFSLAERIAKKQRDRDQGNNHVYRCAKCHGFHIGQLQGWDAASLQRYKKRRRELEEEGVE